MGDPLPDVSVIIPLKNASETIGETLASLAEQDFGGVFEVVVADNGSDDGSEDVVRSYMTELPGLRLVDAGARPGAAFARNEGARHARAPLLAFCDADDVADPGWLDHLVRASQGRSPVGGRLRYGLLNDLGQHTRVRMHQHDALPRSMRYLPYVITANLLVPAEAFAAVGGFNEEFPGAAGEDVDFSFRLQQAGYTLVFAPEAVIEYRLRGSKRDEIRKIHNYACSAPLVYKLHAPMGVRRRSAKIVAYAWARLLLGAPLCLLPSRRHEWLRSAAKQTGYLRGSIRHRVVYL